MRSPGTAGIAVAVSLLAAGCGLPRASAAVDATGPRLVGVSFSRTAVAASGRETAAVTVSVRLVDDTGVVEVADLDAGGRPTPSVRLSRIGAASGGAPSTVLRDLDLTAGTPRDGVWSALLFVPSTFDGSWRVSEVRAEDASANQLALDPAVLAGAARLRVRGSHRPVLTVATVPNPVPPDRARVDVGGRVVDSDTGAPVAGLLVSLGLEDGTDAECGLGSGGPFWGGHATTVTDADGAYRFPDVPARADVVCVVAAASPGSAPYYGYLTTLRLLATVTPRLRPLVTATPSRPSMRVGSVLPVTGVVAPAWALACRGCESGAVLSLQRQVAGAWKSVGEAPVRADGGYRLLASPMGPGRHSYRVLLRAGRRTVATPSRTFAVTARPAGRA